MYIEMGTRYGHSFPSNNLFKNVLRLGVIKLLAIIHITHVLLHTYTFESQCFSFLKHFNVNIFENLPNLILHIFVKI